MVEGLEALAGRLRACLPGVRHCAAVVRRSPGGLAAADCVPLLGAVRQILMECPREDIPELLGAAGDELWNPVGTKTFLPFLECEDEEIVGVAASILTLMAGQGDGLSLVTFALPPDGAGAVPDAPGKLWTLRLRVPGTIAYGFGGLVWPSSRRMTGHLLDGLYARHGVVVRGAHVLEVGCGTCPVPGLLCARLGARSVALTDVDVGGLLAVTRHNVDTNLGADHPHVQVAELDWTRPEECAARAPAVLLPHAFDLLLGSDVIYDRWMAEALPPILHRFLKLAADPGPSPRVVIVLGDRKRSEGIERFEAGMAEHGFECLHVDKSDELSEYVFARRPSPLTPLDVPRSGV